MGRSVDLRNWMVSELVEIAEEERNAQP